MINDSFIYSALSASIGSSLAARHAGHMPLRIPASDDAPTPSTAAVTLMSNGKPIRAEIKYANPKPVPTPMSPPSAVTVTASIRNCVMLRRRIRVQSSLRVAFQPV